MILSAKQNFETLAGDSPVERSGCFMYFCEIEI
ncbi:hypothetical protein HNP37_001989 [Flavobacterium nitrogenifigens]|uniref:Uncharacterized protein n=2 Tax=Flavobacterium TaxID=237 RepID=A0A7W7IX43_9FLAO|nr:hypothetical protein [Flavobacterium nitrogenifigens]MBB6386886.1 hypothetical protein [Flavobacterium notoginsengisoli]